MAEWLALPTLDHEVPGLNPTGGRIQLMAALHFFVLFLNLRNPPLLVFVCWGIIVNKLFGHFFSQSVVSYFIWILLVDFYVYQGRQLLWCPVCFSLHSIASQKWVDSKRKELAPFPFRVGPFSKGSNNNVVWVVSPGNVLISWKNFISVKYSSDILPCCQKHTVIWKQNGKQAHLPALTDFV